jgi:phosphate transporter
VNRSTGGEDAENAPLIQNDERNPDVTFSRALDVELEKVSSFYQLKELEIYGEVVDFLKDETAFKTEAEQQDGEGRPGTSGRMSDRPRQGSVSHSFANRPRRTSTLSSGIVVEDSDDDDEDNDESSALNKTRQDSRKRRKSAPFDVGGDGITDDMRTSTEFSKSVRRNSQVYDDYADQAFSSVYSTAITLKKRAISLFVQLCELKSFVQLNKTGFSKVLKKYDKIMDRSLKSRYIDQFITSANIFRPETITHIEENIRKIEHAYAAVVTQGDITQAIAELRLHLREHVVWERNTVWREMIGIERRGQAANLGIRRTLLGTETDPSRTRLQGDDEDIPAMKEIRTPLGRYQCPSWLFSSTMLTLIIIVAIFVSLLLLPIMQHVEQQNCLAMLVFVSLLWATEVSQLQYLEGFF